MEANNIIEEIKSKCDIVDVIGRYVSLKKAGINYKGICPFHNEKTPSFIVSEDKQIFTCFGCGATGDVIEFIQKYHNLDFHGAIEKLAAENGIELINTGFATEKKRQKLYEINRIAAAFYHQCITQKNNPGFEYMKKRGIYSSTLRKFGIGYADHEWQSLYHYLINRGENPELLLSLGLISKSKGRYYDKYRERIMFPIINTRGKVIGFGGRSIGDEVPKYLNSPESSVFLKKNNLYGLNLTRQDINREDCAVLVEGYMDVISLYQHGIRNISASLGTALTENQAAMLKRYTKNIVLSYDADEAGQTAALRGMDILYAAGCKVKVLEITEEKDPDAFIKKYGKDAFLKLIKQAKPFVEYKLHLIQQKNNIKTTEGKVNYLKEATNILKILSPVEADAYIKKIAGQTNISEGAIRMEVYGNNHQDKQNFTFTKRTQKSKSGKEKIEANLLEKSLIKLMLVNSNYIIKVKPYQDIFRNPICFRIYEIMKSLYQEDEEIDIKKIADSLDETGNRILKDIIENVHLADKEGQVFDDCVAHIQDLARMKREEEIIKLLSILNDENDEGKILALTKELMEIQQEKNRGEIKE
ncbi:MAG: DNA primase [Anaerovoracaceae bacterium]|jgi:DNA primase